MVREVFLLLIVCAIVNAQITTVTKRRNRTRTITPSYNYISNWQNYNIPQRVNTEKLKVILSEVAKFKRLEFCPYEDKRVCEKTDYKNIVSDIILNVVGNDTDDTDQNGANGVNDVNNIKASLRQDLIFFSWLLNGSKETGGKTAVQIKTKKSDENRSSEKVDEEKENENKKDKVSMEPGESQKNSTANDTLKPKAVLDFKYIIFK